MPRLKKATKTTTYLFFFFLSAFIFSSPTSAQVVINEYLPAPTSGDPEWIELYNPTDTAIDLTGYQLDDGEGGTNPYTLSTTINALNYLVVYDSESKIGLNNGADEVRLLNPSGQVVDSTSYSSTLSGKSYGRIPNGTGSFQLVDNPTPNASNGEGVSPSPTIEAKIDNIQFSEIYACPEIGQQEWIELENLNSFPVSLTDWTIKDAANHAETINLNMGANKQVTISWANPFLNNSGDSITLINTQGEQIDSAIFEKCSSDTSYIRNNNQWQMTTDITRDQVNRYNPKITQISSSTSTINKTPTSSPTSKKEENVALDNEEDSEDNLEVKDITELDLFKSISSTYSGSLISSVAGIINMATQSSSISAIPASQSAKIDGQNKTMFTLLPGLAIIASGAMSLIIKYAKH
jgi:hypothetical protein